MIDIIIPCYNSSKTIIGTLYSIINQTIMDKVFVYIIDDCSDDDYTDIYNLFSKYIKLEILKLDRNSGPGIARQYGMDHSNNEYIIFIDSDDTFYSNNSLEVMLNRIQSDDMVFSRMFHEATGNYEYHDGCLHGKMYRRSFLKKYNICFNKVRSHEDNAFNQICLTVAKICYINDVTYNYNYNKNSITNNEDKVKSMNNYVDSMTWALKKVASFNENDLNKYTTTIFIISTLLYCYFNYLTNPSIYNFMLKKLTLIKKMYYEYINFIPRNEYIRIYNNFHYNVIPDLTIEEFLNKIDK